MLDCFFYITVIKNTYSMWNNMKTFKLNYILLLFNSITIRLFNVFITCSEIFSRVFGRNNLIKLFILDIYTCFFQLKRVILINIFIINNKNNTYSMTIIRINIFIENILLLHLESFDNVVGMKYFRMRI